MKATKVFERVYIYYAITKTVQDGLVGVIISMDAYSKYLFKPVFQVGLGVSLTTLQQVFDIILEKYDTNKHPFPICFVSNLTDDYLELSCPKIGLHKKV